MQRIGNLRNVRVEEMKNVKQRIKGKLLLVTVTDIETRQLLFNMSPIPEKEHILSVSELNSTYYIGLLGKNDVVAVQVSMGTTGRDAVGNKVNEAIRLWKPKGIIMLGIAFGIDENKQKIGDILVAQQVIPYESEKLVEGASIPRGIPSQSGTKIYDRFKSAFDWHYSLDGGFSSSVHYGALLSGEKLINNKQFMEELKRKYPEAIGGEMESSGLASAANFQGVHEWIIVKGICDWGYEKDADKAKNQLLAITATINFCKHVLNNEFLILPKREVKKLPATNFCYINTYKLFYYRVSKAFSLQRLSEISGVKLVLLKKCEKLDPTFYDDDIRIFCECPIDDLNRIEKALGLKKGELIITEKELKFGKFKDYYEKNKGLPKLPLKRTNPQIVVFDFDGTIVEARSIRTTWQLLWTKLGYTLFDCAKYHEQFIANKITHQEWCDITAKHFKERGLSAQLVIDVASQIRTIKGLAETLAALRKSNIKVFILSGSIKQIIDTVLFEYKEFIYDISANNFVFDSFGNLMRIEGTKFDFDGKADYIRKISKECNVSPSNVLFVGNSFNDAHVYTSGARTLCINPVHTNPNNKLYWHDCIYESDNLCDILEYVFISK